jgi:hypothetical protein
VSGLGASKLLISVVSNGLYSWAVGGRISYKKPAYGCLGRQDYRDLVDSLFLREKDTGVERMSPSRNSHPKAALWGRGFGKRLVGVSTSLSS